MVKTGGPCSVARALFGPREPMRGQASRNSEAERLLEIVLARESTASGPIACLKDRLVSTSIR